jgi:hypothetical protein
MYDAYKAWGEANAHRPFFETRFATTMKKRFRRDDKRIRCYLGCRLHDVPLTPSRNPVENPYEDR